MWSKTGDLIWHNTLRYYLSLSNNIIFVICLPHIAENSSLPHGMSTFQIGFEWLANNLSHLTDNGSQHPKLPRKKTKKLRLRYCLLAAPHSRSLAGRQINEWHLEMLETDLRFAQLLGKRFSIHKWVGCWRTQTKHRTLRIHFK